MDWKLYRTIFQNGMCNAARSIPPLVLRKMAAIRDERGLTLLHYAIGGPTLSDGDSSDLSEDTDRLSLAEMLLMVGANPLAETNSGQSAIALAQAQNRPDLFALVDCYATCRETGNSAAYRWLYRSLDPEATALFSAVSQNDAETTLMLLRQGNDPNERSFTDSLTIPYHISSHDAAIIPAVRPGMTNLYHACLRGYEDIAHLLLEAGADPNARVHNGLFPLYTAAESGYYRIVEDLIAHGADINQVTPKNCTALLNAAEEGHLSTVRCLLAHGADPSIANKAGGTPSSNAERYGHYSVAAFLENASRPGDLETLLARSSVLRDFALMDDNIRQEAGLPPSLAKAIMLGDSQLVAKAIAAGANVNERDTYNNTIVTPIVEAARQRSQEILDILLKAGADPNFAQANGETALGLAAQNSDYSIAATLLDAGADPNAITPVGPPMVVAANIAIMDLLMSHGANPNKPDADEDLPIVGSIVCRDYEASYFLRLAGSDLQHKNLQGKTPLDIARSLHDEQMASALLAPRYEAPSLEINIDPIRNELANRMNKLINDEYSASFLPSRSVLCDAADISEKQKTDLGKMRDLATIATKEKRKGNLQRANELYMAACSLDSIFDTDVLWGWIKVLLLAKNFKDANYVMRYFSTICARDNARREQLEDTPLDGLPISARTFDFDGYTAFYEFTNTFPLDQNEVEQKIRAFGGSHAWENYRLTTDEYDKFLRYFGIDDTYRNLGVDA
ncbi:ankyrin repeat domain-containing protein [Adlercreutzia sp. R7]|uniref:Ankyrin repeat domain-containing protein n=1 Tax=Adlercreutzia wanghongyangiae TaxID=3111451 RepID=A0ABU6IJS7_9ACTN|nr:ankyrin repeat domain-containing protein [Adlercreutzia sp. R7]